MGFTHSYLRISMGQASTSHAGGLTDARKHRDHRWTMLHRDVNTSVRNVSAGDCVRIHGRETRQPAVGVVTYVLDTTDTQRGTAVLLHGHWWRARSPLHRCGRGQSALSTTATHQERATNRGRGGGEEGLCRHIRAPFERSPWSRGRTGVCPCITAGARVTTRKTGVKDDRSHPLTHD